MVLHARRSGRRLSRRHKAGLAANTGMQEAGTNTRGRRFMLRGVSEGSSSGRDAIGSVGDQFQKSPLTYGCATEQLVSGQTARVDGQGEYVQASSSLPRSRRNLIVGSEKGEEALSSF